MGWGEFLRVKIKVNVTKPLARGRTLKIKDRSYWIAFKYERIPQFCFRCRIISHGCKGCLEGGNRRMRREEKELQFGTWLRAGPPGRRQEKGWGRMTRDSSEKWASTRW
jgi:hypothetical protein